ncbi:MAG: glutamate--tRNA ligase [Vicinamibacterales bacterium]
MTGLRVRFAPSPTGQLHVGNARTALFNWLLARRHGGAFVLRIEDTDVERSTAVSEAAILEDLRWLGLTWDEGPDTGGDVGPYRQSERLERYQAIARAWLDRGLAYHCFCTPADLEAARAQALASGRPPKYPGTCRDVTPEDAARRIAVGTPAAVRFRVPADRDVTFHDLVRGDVTFSTDVIGDPVILRSDGRPAYNFAVVVDDHAMAITHVIRGEDHISNTPRQVLMYEALGATPPAFAHLSLVMGPDHAPLSKRHGATSVAEFRARGFLPEALVNYLALLGWSPATPDDPDAEIVPLGVMAGRFALDHVSHSAAVFDTAKLAWMNRHYLRALPIARVAAEAAPWFERAGYLRPASPEGLAFLETILPMAVESVDRLEEMPARLRFLFDWREDEAARLVEAEPRGGDVVAAFAAVVADRGPLDRDAFRAAAAEVRERTGLKGRGLFHPLRVALTAADSGPELDLAVPAIDRGAGLAGATGLPLMRSCAARAAAVAARLAAGPSGAAER